MKTDRHVTPMLQRSFYDSTQVFSLALNTSAGKRDGVRESGDCKTHSYSIYSNQIQDLSDSTQFWIRMWWQCWANFCVGLSPLLVMNRLLTRASEFSTTALKCLSS
jgi:hypothetical protein